MSKFQVKTISLAAANEYVARLHRHHKKVQGHKFSISAVQDGVVVGVAIVGRPVARRLDDGVSLEITRLCTDGTEHVCSFLYGAVARAGKALGYHRIGTFIREDEPGTSLKAAGWRFTNRTPGKSWSVKSRPREDKTELLPRSRYEYVCGVAANDNKQTQVAA
jgi:hypothetical protein